MHGDTCFFWRRPFHFSFQEQEGPEGPAGRSCGPRSKDRSPATEALPETEVQQPAAPVPEAEAQQLAQAVPQEEKTEAELQQDQELSQELREGQLAKELSQKSSFFIYRAQLPTEYLTRAWGRLFLLTASVSFFVSRTRRTRRTSWKKLWSQLWAQK